MRYQIEFQTESGMKHGGAIQDPEGPSQMVVTWDATVRLEVLGAANAFSAHVDPRAHHLREVRQPQSEATRQTPVPTESRSNTTISKAFLLNLPLAENGQVSAVHGLGRHYHRR